MKDIIRQAVADAAQYLYVEAGLGRASIIAADGHELAATAKRLRLAGASEARDAMLLEWERAKSRGVMQILPRIDNVVIRGPEGFMGRHVMADTAIGVAQRRESLASVTRKREECAGAAWWLFDTFPEWAMQVLLFESAGAIAREAAYRGYKPSVTIPRWLLEEAELCLRQTGENVSLAADLRKYL